MGKSKRTHGKMKGKMQDVAYICPTPVPDNPHPVDMSGVTAACASCQSGNTTPLIDDVMNNESNTVMFKYWLPTTNCMVCQQKEPYHVYDFEHSGITTKKMFEIVAACQLQHAQKMLDDSRHLGDQSHEVVNFVFSSIRKTYKDVKVAKRPLDAIRQVKDIFFQLDLDSTLRGKEKIVFKCDNGLVSFSLYVATLVFRS